MVYGYESLTKVFALDKSVFVAAVMTGKGRKGFEYIYIYIYISNYKVSPAC